MEIKYTGAKKCKTVYGVKPYWEQSTYVFDKSNNHTLEVSPLDKEAVKFLLHPDRKGLFKIVDKDKTTVLESGEIKSEAPKVEVPKEKPKKKRKSKKK